jgi:hypothetical protein
MYDICGLETSQTFFRSLSPKENAELRQEPHIERKPDKQSNSYETHQGIRPQACGTFLIRRASSRSRKKQAEATKLTVLLCTIEAGNVPAQLGRDSERKQNLYLRNLHAK